ncbi:Transcriptional coactivator [Olea europaea subsp. europaea]|nr:Transcriptional coactivator [Olea europaea subsp. europaea]
MVAKHHFTRVDTMELKNLIYQKIGHARAEKYFDQLKRFFSLQLSKVEFDQSCIKTIGRENLSLHNRLIQSILQNACQAKVPPPKARKPKAPLGVKVANGYQRNCMQSLYGDAFPLSPRRHRSPVNRDRKFRDRPSPLGPLGKSPSTTFEETSPRIHEQQSGAELNCLSSRPPIEVAPVEEGEEVEQFAGNLGIRRRSPITAPFGVSINMGCSRKALQRSFVFNTCQNGGELPDTKMLRSCLEKKLEMEGVGISSDCANLLNNSLDAYLKRLIEPCMEIARLPGNHMHEGELNGQISARGNGALLGSYAQRPSHSTFVSMSDFRVAMELKPHILGENWPVKLEKICARAFE